jgi:putative transcriptional regulator
MLPKELMSYESERRCFGKVTLLYDSPKKKSMYKPIDIDRQKLTLMGVSFPDLETLNSVANAIGSNMYEGFEPTPKLIRLYLDCKTGKVKNNQFLAQLKASL